MKANKNIFVVIGLLIMVQTVSAQEIAAEGTSTSGRGDSVAITLNGSVSIDGSAFQDNRSGFFDCDLFHDPQYTWFNAPPDSTCSAHAPIQIPDGANLSSFKCGLFDNATGENSRISVRLRRREIVTGAHEVVFNVIPTNNSGNIQIVLDQTPNSALVDNNAYVYYVDVNVAEIPAVNNALMRIYGCSVSYTL